MQKPTLKTKWELLQNMYRVLANGTGSRVLSIVPLYYAQALFIRENCLEGLDRVLQDRLHLATKMCTVQCVPPFLGGHKTAINPQQKSRR
jgi:hypothetical protein